MQKPIILYEGNYSQQDLEQLKLKNNVFRQIDILDLQLEELFEIEYPHLRFSSSYSHQYEEFVKEEKKRGTVGNWIYFPWNGVLLHTINEQSYRLLRTNRNRNLITLEQQEKLLGTCIGIVGLSVGASIAISIVHNGIATILKLAEMDILSTTNLNRVKARIDQVGIPKIIVTAQDIYGMNPYANLITFENGLKEEQLDNFFGQEPKPQIVFDEIDDFEMKVRMRLKAKEVGTAIIMMTNLGDNVLIDIERYDLDRGLPLFNGLLGDLPQEMLTTKLTEKDKVKYAMRIVDVDHIPTKALESLLEINKTLVGRPQFSSTVAVSGGLAAFLVRQILLDKDIVSGRYYFPFDKLFGFEEDNKVEREQVLDKLQKITLNEE